MAGLVNFSIQLGRTNELLERIAVALERLAPPGLSLTARTGRAITEEDVSIVTDEELWQREQEQERQERQALGLPPESPESPGE